MRPALLVLAMLFEFVSSALACFYGQPSSTGLLPRLLLGSMTVLPTAYRLAERWYARLTDLPEQLLTDER